MNVRRNVYTSSQCSVLSTCSNTKPAQLTLKYYSNAVISKPDLPVSIHFVCDHGLQSDALLRAQLVQCHHHVLYTQVILVG